jgi:hypothetical protein
MSAAWAWQQARGPGFYQTHIGDMGRRTGCGRRASIVRSRSDDYAFGVNAIGLEWITVSQQHAVPSLMQYA